ncbi:hypothetical protein [Haemophilus haemolyticus]|uniref:hypothetical protein n=1 Tax=Haemophilus haemolyticus TaxID=726 RepID=UPI000E58776F|nr:hypothetical protein [Haemophilus haemolyticus]
MPNLIDLSNAEFKKELFKENIFIELSERLEIEMNKKNIDSSELAIFLGKENFYIDALLKGMLDIKLSELAYIFSFFDKFTGIVPVSKEERIKILNIKEHSFLTFNNITKKVSLCTKKEFENSSFYSVHFMTVGVNNNQEDENSCRFKYNAKNIENIYKEDYFKKSDSVHEYFFR